MRKHIMGDKNNAGKGSKPRNNYSKTFRENFGLINWGKSYISYDKLKDSSKDNCSCNGRPTEIWNEVSRIMCCLDCGLKVNRDKQNKEIREYLNSKETEANNDCIDKLKGLASSKYRI